MTHPISSATKLSLLVIVILAALLRFGVVQGTFIDEPLRADSRLYYAAALNIRWHGVFAARSIPWETSEIKPDALAPPLFPMLAALLVRGQQISADLDRVLFMQVFFGILCVFLTFRLFCMFTTPAVALWGAFFTAISPQLVTLCAYFLSESTFVLMMLLSILATAFAARKQSNGAFLLAGLCWGLTALTRFTVEYFPWFLAVIWWGYYQRIASESGDPPRHFLRSMVYFLGAFLCLIGGWKLRNLSVIGAFSDPTLTISFLHHGIYPDFMYQGKAASAGIPYKFDPQSPQIDMSISNALAAVWQRFVAAPGTQLLWYLWGKPQNLLAWAVTNEMPSFSDTEIYHHMKSPYNNQFLFQITHRLAYWVHIPLTLAATFGSILALLKPSWLRLTAWPLFVVQMLAALLIYFIVLHMIGAPFARYGVVLRPIVYGLGVAFIVYAVKTLRLIIRQRNQ